ncbi:MAG TPA: signal peptidase I [Candidatus Limnocylindrales bacterium]|nr:signal peptidase I [Candidatus Limnocylindrales bacterium]
MRPLIPKPSTGLGTVVELIVIVALAIGLALLIQAFLVKPYQIPSESMEPTLDVGQRVLVDRVSYHFGDPQIGDIVVFHPPEGAVNGAECGVKTSPREACPQPVDQEADTNFIKRIVAGPGDRLSIKDGHPVVNGVMADEGFIKPCHDSGTCNLPKTITIPPNDYFMMGDNRSHSDDSRFWGPVPRAWIIGEAFFTYWPPDRIGFL